MHLSCRYELNNLSDGTIHESYMQSYEVGCCVKHLHPSPTSLPYTHQARAQHGSLQVHELMRRAWPDATKCPGYRHAPRLPAAPCRSRSCAGAVAGTCRTAADMLCSSRLCSSKACAMHRGAVCCRETSLEFMRAMHPVAQRVLSCFASGLGLPADYFQETTDVDNPENRTFLQ